MAIPKYKDPITGKWNRITAYGQSGNAVEITEISGETALSDDIITELKNDLNWISYGGGAYRFVSSEEDKRLYSYITEDKISQILVNTLTKTCALRETQITAASVADSIVKRDSYGEIPVSTPSRDSSATNKAYVDEADKDLRLKLSNLEQALNGYILDTTKEAYADLDSAVLKNSVAVGDNVYPIADKTRALVTRIEGKTTKMVQLLDKSTFPATQTMNGVTFTNNGDGTITVNGTVTEDNHAFILIQGGIECIANHKYLIMGCPEGGLAGKSYGISIQSPGNPIVWDVGKGDIFSFDSHTTITLYLDFYTNNATYTNKVATPQLFDLTAMNREDITSVDQFKAEFPEFYPYENGNIYPAKISGVKFTGKNLKNIPNGIGSKDYAANELPKNISLALSARLSLKEGNARVRASWIKNGTREYAYGNTITASTGISKVVFTIPSSATDTRIALQTFGDDVGFEYSNVQIEAGTVATAYEPYIEPVSVTLPETYDLHGIGDYKDYLEITKNEDNELYTLKKIQQIENKMLNGTETVNKSGYTTTNYQSYYISLPVLYVNNGLGGICNKLPTAINTKDIAHVTFGINNVYPYLFLDKETYTTEDSVKAYLAAQYAANDPLIIYYIRQTPVETVIATNLTYEQVTAIRHNGGLIEVQGNTNKGYARPTVTNTIVYRLTATNTAEG